MWRCVSSSMEWIGVEMSKSDFLGGDLTHSYDDLYLLVFCFFDWHIGVDEGSFWMATLGRVLLFRDVLYVYLSLMPPPPNFFKVVPCLQDPLIWSRLRRRLLYAL